MLKTFKILVLSASIIGVFLIFSSYPAKAGVAFDNPGDCVDYCKARCEQGQYKECTDNCTEAFDSKKDRAKCIVNCNQCVACCNDNCLYYECGIGADSHPAFCQDGLDCIE